MKKNMVWFFTDTQFLFFAILYFRTASKRCKEIFIFLPFKTMSGHCANCSLMAHEDFANISLLPWVLDTFLVSQGKNFKVAAFPFLCWNLSLIPAFQNFEFMFYFSGSNFKTFLKKFVFWASCTNCAIIALSNRWKLVKPWVSLIFLLW